MLAGNLRTKATARLLRIISIKRMKISLVGLFEDRNKINQDRIDKEIDNVCNYFHCYCAYYFGKGENNTVHDYFIPKW